MSTTDIDRDLQAWFEAAEPQSAPASLLPNVFSVTRQTGQRRGLRGRLSVALLSGAAVLQPAAVSRALNIAVLILLVALLVAGAGFIGGQLRRTPAGWRVLDQSPIEGETTSVTSVMATRFGFVAVGTSAQPEAAQCPTGRARARVWTSVDGDRWVSQASQSFSGVTSLTNLVQFGSSVYVFAESATACTASEPPRRTLWRSTDGVDWERLPEAPIFYLGNVPAMADAGGTLVALGIYQEPPPAETPDAWGDPVTRVWATTDGLHWRHVATLADTLVASLAAHDGSLVALGYHSLKPGKTLLYSSDAGQTWLESTGMDDAPGALIVAGDGQFVAAGDGWAATSPDGRSWTYRGLEALAGAYNLWALPNGFLVQTSLGENGTPGCGTNQPYPSAYESPVASTSVEPIATAELVATAEPAPTVAAGSCPPPSATEGSWFSPDGIDWRPAPMRPAPMLPSPDSALPVGILPSTQMAANADAVIISGFDFGPSVWLAPLSDFEP